MKRTATLLAVSVLLVSFLLASLWMVSSDAPVQADEPPVPVIPRHRAGHRAKVQNLDEILAQTDGGDPLSGNYTLARDDEILLAFTGTSPSGTFVHWQAQEVDSNLDTPGWINEGYLTGDKPAAATGNFNGDRLEDFVILRTVDGGRIHMDVGYLDDGINLVIYNLDTTETHLAGYPPRVATGDFDGDTQDEIFMAWEGGGDYANLKVYDPLGGIHPAARAKLYD